MTNDTIPTPPFDPRHEGARRWFPPLEAAVIEYLWSTPGYATAIRIANGIDYEKRLAVQTILTTCKRLVNKGIIVGRKPVGSMGRNGGTWTYKARYDRATWETVQAEAIIRSLGAVELTV